MFKVTVKTQQLYIYIYIYILVFYYTLLLCFDGNFKHFVSFLESKHNGISSIKKKELKLVHNVIVFP